ncbi:hypothetical protein LOK49_LG13G02010 [Camellia lanceoleosa]|uniref:Uncharacterized protein n=1 Tax=Camellia lanceoleosa TaxID=1840588 RepID=A0ACC0FIS9_9ERIC|nr:hypothetical protein LOK49_LG13G02010 [Camellia lanceoleosa]
MMGTSLQSLRRRRERRIRVAEEVAKESFEMETFAMEDIEVFEFIERLHERLCVFFCDFIFSVSLDQEPVKVIDDHDSILS